MQHSAYKISGFIDHTLLKQDATSEQIKKVCAEAKKFGFFGVCVNSIWLPLAVSELNGSSVCPVAVIGFPLGAMATDLKTAEARWCVQHGAKEIDMVISIGHLKEKNYSYVKKDIAAVVEASKDAIVKVIIETAFLNDEEKKTACELAAQAGAHFVKTCTGFGGGAATLEDIKLMRAVVGPKIGVKASGGIKNLKQAIDLIEAGATRLGTSSGVSIIEGSSAVSGY